MTGVIFMQIIINAIIFSGIFWILTFLAKVFYTNKYFNYKLNFYECGFKNFTKVKTLYSINYIMLILFLLIYDGEFLILIPLAFNSSIVSVNFLLGASAFILWLIIALVFDYIYKALDWQV